MTCLFEYISDLVCELVKATCPVEQEKLRVHLRILQSVEGYWYQQNELRTASSTQLQIIRSLTYWFNFSPVIR